MKKENKDFNMIAYADIDQFIEIDLIQINIHQI